MLKPVARQCRTYGGNKLLDAERQQYVMIEECTHPGKIHEVLMDLYMLITHYEHPSTSRTSFDNGKSVRVRVQCVYQGILKY